MPGASCSSPAPISGTRAATPRSPPSAATGAEKSEWWDRSVEAFPDYADYQTKTERVIALFALEPVPKT